MDEPREQTAVLNCFLKLPTILFSILTNHSLVACVPQRSNDVVDLVCPDFNAHPSFSFPVVGMLFSTGNFVGNFSIIGIMLVWLHALRPNIISFVLLAFAFRAATLYLRPVEAHASAHRLSITTILLLTTTAAVTLSFDAVVIQFALEQKLQRVQLPSSQRFVELVMFVFREFSTILFWFSIAWLSVARNPRRWIGVLGLLIHFAMGGLIDFLVFPVYWDQVQPIWGTKQQLGIWYFVGSFAVNIFHDLIVLLCFGIIHVAGYRWDIRRPSLASDDALDTKETIPPVLATRTELSKDHVSVERLSSIAWNLDQSQHQANRCGKSMHHELLTSVLRWRRWVGTVGDAVREQLRTTVLLCWIATLHSMPLLLSSRHLRSFTRICRCRAPISPFCAQVLMLPGVKPSCASG